MNSKKVNILFLLIILVRFAIEVLLAFLWPVINISIVGNYLLSEGIVIIPALLVAWASRERIADFVRFRKMKAGSLLMIILITILTSPAISLMNLFSQLFVRNEIVEISPTIMQMPFGISFFFIAIFAPVCEETVCRGIMYQGYKKSGSAFIAMILSALAFACIHLNFNQASYAFLMGIFSVLLVEATGSLWSSIFYHVLINGQSVCLLYFYKENIPEALTSQAMNTITDSTDMMFAAIGIYVLLAAITLPLAYGVLVWMARYQGRSEQLRNLWISRKIKKDKMITIPLIIALILCLAYMIVGLLAAL